MTNPDSFTPNVPGAFVTPVLQVPPGAYIRAMAGEHLLAWRWTLIPAVILFALAVGLHDLRWAITGFIWVCIVAPGILTLTVLRLLANPHYAAVSLPHRITVVPGEKIWVEWPERPERAPIEIPWSRVKRHTPGRIVLRNPRSLLLLTSEWKQSAEEKPE